MLSIIIFQLFFSAKMKSLIETFKMLLLISLISVEPVFAQQNSFHINFDGIQPRSASGLRISCGEEIKITATGQIRVGFLAGNRSPKGADYEKGKYNIFADQPHGALMICISEKEIEGNTPNYKDLGWLVCAEALTFKASKSGFLIFDINDSMNWRWDNRPLGNGFQIDIKLPDRDNSKTTALVGFLKEQPVYKQNDIISFGCQQFTKQSDGYWHILDGNNHSVGLYTTDKPNLFKYIGKNRYVDRPKDVYGEYVSKSFLIYEGQRVQKSVIDNRWYLKNTTGYVVGIVDPQSGSHQIHANNARLEELLKHLNRNSLNQEAKGKLQYMCSQKVTIQGKHRWYVDEAGCVWTLLLESEAKYHKNPENGAPAFKFVRLNPNGTNASFETVRVPRPNEDWNSQTIVGTQRVYKIENKAYNSFNLRDSESRGTYNYSNSTWASINFFSHYWADIEDHGSIGESDGYKDYAIFQEKFGSPSSAEINLVRQLNQIPLNKDGERTCPSR